MENQKGTQHFIFPYSIQEHQETIQDKDHLHLKVIDYQGVTIGFILLRGLLDEHQNIELKRIVIHEKNKGYGKMTLKMLQQLAFEKLNAHRLWLDVFTDNPRAQHVYKAVGFKEEGIKRECVKSENGFRSLILMSILKQEFTP